LVVFEAGGAGTASLEVWQEGAGSAAGCARHFHRLIILLWGAECKTLCVYRGLVPVKGCRFFPQSGRGATKSKPESALLDRG